MSSIPVLGQIPFSRQAKHSIAPPIKAEAISHQQAPKPSFQTSITQISQNLCHTFSSSPSNVILITSTMPSEGKTTFAIHLAQSLSKQYKTLLIDADFRIPAIAHRYHHTHPMPGFRKALAHPKQYQSYLFQDPHYPLDILPNSIQSKQEFNPEEINTLFSVLTSKYRFIILDTAPVYLVPDALQFSTVIDHAILVTTPTTAAKAFAQNVDLLMQAQISILGLIQNKWP